MTHRRVDKERIERADRESKLTIEAERLARETKTARLREQRLSAEQPSPVSNVVVPPRSQAGRGKFHGKHQRLGFGSRQSGSRQSQGRRRQGRRQ